MRGNRQPDLAWGSLSAGRTLDSRRWAFPTWTNGPVNLQLDSQHCTGWLVEQFPLQHFVVVQVQEGCWSQVHFPIRLHAKHNLQTDEQQLGL